MRFRGTGVDVCLELPATNLLLSDRPTLLTVGVIGPGTPLFIDMQGPLIGDERELPDHSDRLHSKDIAGRSYEQTMVVDLACEQLPLGLGGDHFGEGMSRQLAQIESAVKGMGASIGTQLKAQDQYVRSVLQR